MVRRLFLVVSVFLLTGAFARDKSEDWLEVCSPHFIVVSNANEKQVRNLADQFERMRALFEKLFPRLVADAGPPITVIAVRNEKEFRSLEPAAYLAKGEAKIAGFFLRVGDGNYILLRLDAEGGHPYSVVYHEYTHFLMRKTQEWLPLWLNEGLAEFYQNTELRDKDALLGQPNEGNIYLLRQKRLLPLSTLFLVDHNSSYYHEENRVSIFYAESWALTHYFWIKDFKENTHKLQDYVQLLHEKVEPVSAATRVFGDLKKLQAVLDLYVQQTTFAYFKLSTPTTVNTAEFKLRPLSAVESAAARAEFLAYNQRCPDARDLAEAVLRDDSR